MNIDCATHVGTAPRPVLSADGESYLLNFRLPAPRIKWLKVYLEDGYLAVRAQLRTLSGGHDEDEPPSIAYEEKVVLPSDIKRQAFLPLLEDGNLKLTLYRELPALSPQ